MQYTKHNHTFHIALDGSGDFSSITDALAFLDTIPAQEPVTLFIHNGIYKERLTITRPHLTLIGDSAGNTILTYDLYARMPQEEIGRAHV